MAKEKYVSVTLFKEKLREMAYHPHMTQYPVSANIIQGLDAKTTLEHYHQQNYSNMSAAVNMAIASMIQKMIIALDESAIDGGQCYLCKTAPHDVEPEDNYCASGGFKSPV